MTYEEKLKEVADKLSVIKYGEVFWSKIPASSKQIYMIEILPLAAETLKIVAEEAEYMLEDFTKHGHVKASLWTRGIIKKL